MFDMLRHTVNLERRTWLTIARYATNLIAPPFCALCGGAGQRGDEPWGIDLCIHCEAACPQLHHACPRCAEPLPDEPGCRRHAQPAPFDAVHGLYLYADPVDQMITGLKFRRELAYARILGTLLARKLRRRDLPTPDCIVPMPLHRARYLERGFTQSAEIAAHVAPRLDIPLNTRLLYRRRATLPQSGLTAAARIANISGAFSIRRGGRMPARIALLDDVMTTGSTAAAAAQTLRAAGAQHVEIWVCARARRSEEPDRDGTSTQTP
jgi:ComF family protein